MAHLFIVDSFNRKNVKISTTYYFMDFSFFMPQDDAHYQNHRNAPGSGRLLKIPEAMVTEVLRFADKRHQGYAVAYKRLKTWANFRDFKRKVFYKAGLLGHEILHLQRPLVGSIHFLKMTSATLFSNLLFRSTSALPAVWIVGIEVPSFSCLPNRGKPSRGDTISNSLLAIMGPER